MSEPDPKPLNALPPLNETNEFVKPNKKSNKSLRAKKTTRTMNLDPKNTTKHSSLLKSSQVNVKRVTTRSSSKGDEMGLDNEEIEEGRFDEAGMEIRDDVAKEDLVNDEGLGIKEIRGEVGKSMDAGKGLSGSVLIAIGYGRASFARVLIKVDVANRIVDKVEIWSLNKTKELKVDYAWQPPVCSHCCVFGHSFKGCNNRFLSEEEKVKRNKAKAQASGESKSNPLGNRGWKSIHTRRFNKDGFDFTSKVPQQNAPNTSSVSRGWNAGRGGYGSRGRGGMARRGFVNERKINSEKKYVSVSNNGKDKVSAVEDIQNQEENQKAKNNGDKNVKFITQMNFSTNNRYPVLADEEVENRVNEEHVIRVNIDLAFEMEVPICDEEIYKWPIDLQKYYIDKYAKMGKSDERKLLLNKIRVLEGDISLRRNDIKIKSKKKLTKVLCMKWKVRDLIVKKQCAEVEAFILFDIPLTIDVKESCTDEMVEFYQQRIAENGHDRDVVGKDINFEGSMKDEVDRDDSTHVVFMTQNNVSSSVDAAMACTLDKVSAVEDIQNQEENQKAKNSGDKNVKFIAQMNFSTNNRYPVLADEEVENRVNEEQVIRVNIDLAFEMEVPICDEEIYKWPIDLQKYYIDKYAKMGKSNKRKLLLNKIRVLEGDISSRRNDIKIKSKKITNEGVVYEMESTGNSRNQAYGDVYDEVYWKELITIQDLIVKKQCAEVEAFILSDIALTIDVKESCTDEMVEFYLQRIAENGQDGDVVGKDINFEGSMKDEVDRDDSTHVVFMTQNNVSSSVDAAMACTLGDFNVIMYADEHQRVVLITTMELWDHLSEHMRVIDGHLWTILGDFNVIMYVDEHSKTILNVAVKRTRSFRFMNFLADKKEFHQTVRDKWNELVNGFAMFILARRLKGMKMHLRSLNTKNGNVYEKVKKLIDELNIVQIELDKDPHNVKLKEDEMVFNSAYREAVIDEEKGRLNRSRIITVSDELGRVYQDEEVVGQFVSHFQSFLGTCDEVFPIKEPDGLFYKKLEPEIALNIVREVSNDEVKAALNDINDNKAPRPNGFTSRFFKAY
nr:hypothetical protein [Tanacetum cinerariifolium]